MLCDQNASQVFMTGAAICVSSKFAATIARSRERGSLRAAVRRRVVADHRSRSTCRIVASSSPSLSPK